MTRPSNRRLVVLFAAMLLVPQAWPILAFAVVTVTPGLTNAPDATAVVFRAGGDVQHASVDVRWDAPAVADSGGSGSAELITLDGVGVGCLTPGTGSVTPSGGIDPGGNATTTWTMACGPITEGTYAGLAPSPANIARALVFGDTATDSTHSFFNGLEQVNVSPGGRTTNLPDLVSVTFSPAVDDGHGNVVDKAVYTFSLVIATLNAPGSIGVTPVEGGDASTIADSSGPFPGDGPLVTGAQVRIFYPAGTLAQVTQGYVDAEAVTSADAALLNAPGQVAEAAGPPLGAVVVDAGAAATNSQSATLTFPNTDSDVADVLISNNADMSAAQTFPYIAGMGTTWALAGLANGSTQSVYVRFRDQAGDMSATFSDSIVVDLTRPTMGSLLRPRLVMGEKVGTTVPLLLSWHAASDTVTSVAGYVVQASQDGGPYTVVRRPSHTQTYVAMLPSRTYRFRVTATDQAGNTSTAVSTTGLEAVAFQESSQAVRYRGKWTTQADSRAWGGHLRYSGVRGASAKLTFTGRGIAWIAETSPYLGNAVIYVDGSRVATINLREVTTYRWTGYVRMWASDGRHTLRVVVAGSAGHRRVDIDGFVVVR